MILAAKTGEVLIQVKESLPHGEYLLWIDANMPINKRQCSKFVKLVTTSPDLALKGHSNALLDIESELKLLCPFYTWKLVLRIADKSMN